MSSDFLWEHFCVWHGVLSAATKRRNDRPRTNAEASGRTDIGRATLAYASEKTGSPKKPGSMGSLFARKSAEESQKKGEQGTCRHFQHLILLFLACQLLSSI